ncbi:MAG: DUF1887 family CARF protein [Thiolinea sp.]
MNLHICLVSDQLLANYIPVIMDRPDQVHLVSSAYMVNKGMTARFRKMLEQQGFSVFQHDNMPDHDIGGIRRFAEQLWEAVDKQVPDDPAITLNLTGGNKLMTLAMWDVFKGIVERIVYTDTFNNCIEYLHDQTREPLRSVLDIPQYLQAYGVKFLQALSDDEEWLAAVNQRKPVSKYLAENAERLGDFIGVLNKLANDTLEEENHRLLLRYPTQYFRNPPRGIWRDALRQLQQSGLLKWDGDREVTFTNPETVRYLGGIWLEEYVYLIARDANPEHVACSVKINWDSSRNATNELDVILVHHNRMLVIECKTLRFGNDQQKDSDMVYKISDLGDDLRGLFGKTWLVSAREPTPRLLDRAKSRRLAVISAAGLKDLRRSILDWMDGG